MRALLILLALLALPFTAKAEHPYQAEFDFACEILHSDCSQIVPPTVIVTQLFWNTGNFGSFNPEYPRLIWIDGDVLPQISKASFSAALVHEMTHYIDYHSGTIEFVLENLCIIEARGFAAMNAWYTAHDEHDKRDVNWQERYGC